MAGLLGFGQSFGDYGRAERNVCEAFSYRYGATIARTFQPTDQAVVDVCGYSLSKIFAQEEKALELMNPPKDAEVELLVKTVQGEYSTKEPVYGYDYEPGPLEGLQISLRGRQRVVVSYQTNSTLLCGLELVQFSDTRSP